MYIQQAVYEAPPPPPPPCRSPVPHRGACRRGYWRGVGVDVGVAGATEATGRVCEETELRASVYRATVTRLAVARAAADDRRCIVGAVLTGYCTLLIISARGAGRRTSAPKILGSGRRVAPEKNIVVNALASKKILVIAYWPEHELRRCAGGNRAELARSPWAHYVRRA